MLLSVLFMILSSAFTSDNGEEGNEWKDIPPYLGWESEAFDVKLSVVKNLETVVGSG